MYLFSRTDLGFQVRGVQGKKKSKISIHIVYTNYKYTKLLFLNTLKCNHLPTQKQKTKKQKTKKKKKTETKTKTKQNKKQSNVFFL